MFHPPVLLLMSYSGLVELQEQCIETMCVFRYIEQYKSIYLFELSIYVV